MKDTNRFLLLYMDMLLKCKDNEIADFLMNTAYFSDNGRDINLHNYSIVELKKIRENIIKYIMDTISKDLDSEILKSVEYKPKQYDGQINIWEKFYALDMWSIATGIWLIICILRSIFNVTVKNK